DRLLAQRLRERERGAERLVAGRDRAHDLDELHDRHRIEEVEADDAVGTLRRGGHGRDGERAGVAGENGFGRADVVQLAEHRVLGLEILGDGLDHEIGIGEVGERGGGLDPVEGLIAQRGVELALFDGAIEAARDGLDAAFAELIAHFADPRAITRPGGDLGDSAAHQATAQDGYCLYLRHCSSVETDPGWTREYAGRGQWFQPTGRRAAVPSALNAGAMRTWRCRSGGATERAGARGARRARAGRAGLRPRGGRRRAGGGSFFRPRRRWR